MEEEAGSGVGDNDIQHHTKGWYFVIFGLVVLAIAFSASFMLPKNKANLPATNADILPCNKYTLLFSAPSTLFIEPNIFPAKTSQGNYYVVYNIASLSLQESGVGIFDLATKKKDTIVKNVKGVSTSVVAQGNRVLYDADLLNELRMYDLGADGLPETSDDEDYVVAQKHLTNGGYDGQKMKDIAGNSLVYWVEVERRETPLGERIVGEAIYHNIGSDNIPNTADDYRYAILRTDNYVESLKVSATGKFIASHTLYDLGSNMEYDASDQKLEVGEQPDISSDGRYVAWISLAEKQVASSSPSQKRPAVTIYDLGADGRLNTADDRRTAVTTKTLQAPSETTAMKNKVPIISHDPGTNFKYPSIEGSRLVFDISVEGRMYIDAGADGLFETDDDYVKEYAIQKGGSDGNTLQAYGPQRLIDDMTIAEGNGVYAYRFCR